MNCLIHLEPDADFVEVDPTGRYGRYNEILGKGASKTVYKAFDEYEGIEVAWNQVKLYDCLQSPEDLERLYCEIHLLKTLKHQNIMKFYTSWVDTANRNINFVTEMFTSGTLRQYRLKHKRVNIRALKHWCRQILKGLLYLHSHDPPVIHRDLKCDNIFVNGNQGELKIGDLGLAAILRKSHAVHCVGTPEFMAPEVYAEEYNELVDIYSFGMCILEMVTFEYPYSECSHPAQIYKKVISGKKPDALYKVEDPEIRQFVEKCLATVSLRLSARELLDDPFLYIEGCEPDFAPVDYRRELECITPLNKRSFPDFDYQRKTISNSLFNSHYNGHNFEDLNEWEWYNRNLDQNGNDELVQNRGEELDEENDQEHAEEEAEEEESSYHDVTIKGKRREDGSIFLRLRISDNEGRIRNIYFPFDIVYDTALSVATEMVNEVDIIDQDVIMIADMIDGEIAALVPEWKEREENSNNVATNPLYCNNCVSTHTSTGSLMNFLSGNNLTGSKNLQILQCLGNGCAATHGRFEEVTYQTVDSPLPKACKTEDCIDSSSEPNFWDHPESSTLDSTESHSSEEHENIAAGNFVGNRNMEQFSFDVSNDYEHEIHQELKWLNKKHQILTGELEEDQEKGTRNSFSFRNQ